MQPDPTHKEQKANSGGENTIYAMMHNISLFNRIRKENIEQPKTQEEITGKRYEYIRQICPNSTFSVPAEPLQFDKL